MNIAVIGASNKPDRYSYKTLLLLREKGYTPLPVNPALTDIEGIPVWPSLSRIPMHVDVVTIYLRPGNQAGLLDDIRQCAAKQVIFNPGTENPPLAADLRAAGIDVIDGCTLVMLMTDQMPDLTA